MTEQKLPTFNSLNEIISFVEADCPEDCAYARKNYSAEQFIEWAVEQACYAPDSDGGIGCYADPAEAFDQVLAIARVAKRDKPELTLQVDKYSFWSTPWNFETDDVVIYAMFWAATYLECDEFAVDETDEATVDGYRELIRWGKEAGATDELIGDYAESLFRRNHALASKLGFGECFEPEKEWESAES